MNVLMLLSISFLTISCGVRNELHKEAAAQVSKEIQDPLPIDYSDTEVLFDFSNIDSVIYSGEDCCLILHYNDYDAFDYDNLADYTNRDVWYGEYVELIVPHPVDITFLADYNTWKSTTDWNVQDSLNEEYSIIERDIKYKDGDYYDIIFFLVKKNI